MAFELHHSSIKAFLVPNHGTVTVKLRGEKKALDQWHYRGFDDDKQFVLLSKKEKLRWVPINSISYIEQDSAKD
ncbi:hypothetical protein NBRC116583_32040 [Arenicella sp. 4NH20-0111]|uniref:hypothetical protein n=1 Tax=Arenicella sp. 4NH20-0111 TaxID=3127648 RepID=UPI003104F308